MTFTYDPSLDDDISRVRRLIGDVVAATVKMPDETITAYLLTKGVLGAAAQCAYDLAAQYAVMVDMEVDNQNNKASQLSAQYTALGDRLTAQATAKAAADVSGFSGVYVGGIGDHRGADLRTPYEYEWPYI